MDLYLLPENTACGLSKSSLKLKVTKHHSWRNFRRFLFVAYRQKSGSWVSKKIFVHIFKHWNCTMSSNLKKPTHYQRKCISYLAFGVCLQMPVVHFCHKNLKFRQDFQVFRYTLSVFCMHSDVIIPLCLKKHVFFSFLVYFLFKNIFAL